MKMIKIIKAGIILVPLLTLTKTPYASAGTFGDQNCGPSWLTHQSTQSFISKIISIERLGDYFTKKPKNSKNQLNYKFRQGNITFEHDDSARYYKIKKIPGQSVYRQILLVSSKNVINTMMSKVSSIAILMACSRLKSISCALEITNGK